MRVITFKAVRAFNNGRKFKQSNTEVRIEGDMVSLYLHNNKIAERSPNGFYITNAGWASNTTKERLNGLDGVSIYQKNWNWYLNGKEWNGGWYRIK